eukprot:scaffold5333_cov49-Attheya_sp.AAC.2
MKPAEVIKDWWRVKRIGCNKGRVYVMRLRTACHGRQWHVCMAGSKQAWQAANRHCGMAWHGMACQAWWHDMA